MPLHLLTLPLEIRCQIFSYLLVSPSKHVITLPPGPWVFSILPWDMRQEITLESHTGARILELSLFRVSKQLNAECKELLWGRNTVVCNPFEVQRHTDGLSGKVLGPLVSARHVAMHVDMTIGGLHMEGIARALKVLGKWSKSGSLKEITLIVVNERRKPFRERDDKEEKFLGYRASLERMIRYRTGTDDIIQAQQCFQGYLSLFRDARDGCLADLRRKTVVNTNFDRLSSQDQRKYLREACMDPNCLMLELNEAFRGELWVDGTLSFKEGEQIRDAFQPSLDNGHSQGIEGADLVVTAEDARTSKTPEPAETSSHI